METAQCEQRIAVGLLPSMQPNNREAHRTGNSKNDWHSQPRKQLMNMQKFNLGLSTSIDYDSEAITMTARADGVVTRWLYDTREKSLREALVNLGWTPPPEPRKQPLTLQQLL